MKTSSENGSDCNTALAGGINSILVVLWNVLPIVLACAFCITLSSMATSLCFSYMEIWGYRCILGALLSHVGNLVEQHPIVRTLVLSTILVFSKIPLLKVFCSLKNGVLEMRKSDCISELPSRKKSPGIFFYPAGESLPQSSSHVFFQSMKTCNCNWWNSRHPQGQHHLWMCPPFTWSCCGIPHCKVLLRNYRFWGA